MILELKQTAVAYRCSSCGTNIISVVGVFSLSGDMIKLKCDCKNSELVITYTKDGKVRLSVPCLICAKPHNFLIGDNVFFKKELFTLSCTYTGLDICFIGKKDAVLKALEKSDEELAGLIAEAGNIEAQDAGDDDCDGGNVERDTVFDVGMVHDIVRFILSELRDEGSIHCNCAGGGGGEYDFEIAGENVRVFCRKCKASVLVPMSSTLTANAFLNCSELILK